MGDPGPTIAKLRRDYDTSTMGPIKEVPDGMLTRQVLVQLVKELQIGERFTVERIGERKIRITRG